MKIVTIVNQHLFIRTSKGPFTQGLPNISGMISIHVHWESRFSPPRITIEWQFECQRRGLWRSPMTWKEHLLTCPWPCSQYRCFETCFDMGWCIVYLVGLEPWNFMTFHPVGNVIIPSDEVIFFRGVGIPPVHIYTYILYAMIYNGMMLNDILYRCRGPQLQKTSWYAMCLRGLDEVAPRKPQIFRILEALS